MRAISGREGRYFTAALLLGTLVFWLYGLSANGYANSFYSAAVQAGSQSWEAFFYGSSDAANSITVDKPPASLWAMALSVRIFGLNSWAILVPEVLMGVATVALVYAGVRRYFGHAAGLLAGTVLALTPVATLMFRFNNPDALLALLLTAACVATMRAIEKASPRWLMLAGVLLVQQVEGDDGVGVAGVAELLEGHGRAARAVVDELVRGEGHHPLRGQRVEEVLGHQLPHPAGVEGGLGVGGRRLPRAQAYAHPGEQPMQHHRHGQPGPLVWLPRYHHGGPRLHGQSARPCRTYELIRHQYGDAYPQSCG